MKQTAITILFILVSCLASQAAEKTKPNILFIAIDDLNDWTGMLKGNPQARFATVHLRQ
mgnify:CR=1 FL=1